MLGALVCELQKTEEERLRRFFARRFRSSSEAADATQETFLRMLEVSQKTVIENPQAYLYRVAASVARVTSARAAAGRQALTLDSEALEVADDAPGQEQVVNGRQCLVLMAKAIGELPNRCQAVFILSRVHGLSNGEIAEALGITRNMVEKHIIRALLRCRQVRLELSF
jgi:RNA polymerase sigma-70 factor (ECF subfamily)